MARELDRTNKFGLATSYVVKKLWTVFAILLVLVALSMSLLRYSLPFLNDYKGNIEQFIANEYSLDLDIGEISASWKSNGPAIVLRNVSIKNSVKAPLELTVGEVFLDVDFWPTVAARKLQSNQVTLDNLVLSIDITELDASNADFPIIEALESIFLEQLSNFVVSNSRLNLISQENEKTIDIVKLSWLNKNKRHQGVGEFVLEDFSDNSASFILDLNGSADSYSGSLYAQAQDVNLSAYINEFTGLKNQLVSSKGNFKLWGKIGNGELKRIDGQVLPTSFEWTTAQTSVSNLISANFSATKTQKRWDFSIADLQLKTQGDTLKSNINGYYVPQEGLVFNLAEPVPLKPLFPLSQLFSIDLADKLAMVDLNADLQNLSAKVNEKGLSLQGSIVDIAWQEHNEVAGVNDLRANIFWQGKRGKIVLTAHDTTVDSQYYFSRTLDLSKLELPIVFDFNEQDRTKANISVNNAIVEIDGLSLTIDTQYALQNKFLSLAIDVQPFDIEKVPSLLPKHFVGAGTRSFLKRAFMGKGNVTSADVLWHGALDGFPFTDNSGVFQSNVSVGQADFSFSDGWPALRKLDIDLYFENMGLSMQSPSSFLDKVALTNLQADVPSLSANAMLTITADGAANSDDITSLMLQSSLANSLGELLRKDVLLDGDLTTQLSLYIPLQDGSKTRAKGDVYLNGNNLLIPAIDIEFNDTKGLVSFDNETINIDAMQASLLQQAVVFDVSGQQLNEQYALDVNLSGDWQVAPLVANTSKEFASLFAGQAKWQLDLALKLMANKFTYTAKLDTDLKDVQADLPSPLTKIAGQKMPLQFLANGDQVASNVDIQLGDIAHFDGALAHQEKQFNRAHLALGQTELESRGLGFSISADFETLRFDEWIPFIGAFTAGINPSQKPLIGMPQRIFIDTEKVIVAGQTLSDVDITVKRLEEQWALDIDANEMRGRISLFDERFSKGIAVNAEYIRIAKWQPTSQQNQSSNALSQIDFEPKSLPRIDFTCKACDINGINLGRVELKAQPNNDGLKITQLMINNEFGNVNTSGQWYKRNQDHYTFLAGNINSNKFGEFINQLGFDSGIKDSSANLSFTLTWKDSPLDISLENIDGQIDWQLSDGYLTEVSDQGSRIFTLLSLNSLVRKLSLDFRDVFAKGFFYDNMKGSVQIAKGIADTRDTFIDGAAGEIEIYGYTDLVSQELNYNVSFTPNVTGNLPVLVYFFTVSPPTALAALAIDQVLTSTKVISNINYSVTGTIKAPNLIETGRESTEVDLPARRDVLPPEDLEPFVPPTKDELIEIDVQDGPK